MAMPDKPRKQKTPKGYEIPVPKRGTIDAVLKRAAKGSTTRRPSK
jgi:hypothetical protein